MAASVSAPSTTPVMYRAASSADVTPGGVDADAASSSSQNGGGAAGGRDSPTTPLVAALGENGSPSRKKKER